MNTFEYCIVTSSNMHYLLGNQLFVKRSQYITVKTLNGDDVYLFSSFEDGHQMRRLAAGFESSAFQVTLRLVAAGTQ